MVAKGRVDVPTMPTQVAPPSKDAPVSKVRPESIVAPYMTVTIDGDECERWQAAGGHLVSITKVDPLHPMKSKNRYVFRETREELDALVKRYQEELA